MYTKHAFNNKQSIKQFIKTVFYPLNSMQSEWNRLAMRAIK